MELWTYFYPEEVGSKRLCNMYLATNIHDLTRQYLLTYTTDHSPSWEANRFSANQEIPRIVWNPKVHYRINSCSPTSPYLSQLNRYQSISPGPRLSSWTFRIIIRFHGEEWLAPRPTPKVGNTPCWLSATAYSIYSQHIGGRVKMELLAVPSRLCLESAIRNLRETYQCRIYSRKLLMMGREEARNMQSFITE